MERSADTQLLYARLIATLARKESCCRSTATRWRG